MEFKKIKKIYGLSNAEMARIFGLKNAQAFATSSAKDRMEKAVENIYKLFKAKMYTVAQVSEQVTGNYVAWSTPISHHETLSAARQAAQSLRQTEGYIVIIHDGENCY